MITQETTSFAIEYVSNIDRKHVKLKNGTLGGLFDQLHQKYLDEGIQRQHHVEHMNLLVVATIENGKKVTFQLQRTATNTQGKRHFQQKEIICDIEIDIEKKKCVHAHANTGSPLLGRNPNGIQHENAWETINDIPDEIFTPCVEMAKMYDMEKNCEKDFDVSPTQVLNTISEKREVYTTHDFGDIEIHVEKETHYIYNETYVAVRVFQKNVDMDILSVHIPKSAMSSIDMYEKIMEEQRKIKEGRRCFDVPLIELYTPPVGNWAKKFLESLHLHMKMGCLSLENSKLW